MTAWILVIAFAIAFTLYATWLAVILLEARRAKRRHR